MTREELVYLKKCVKVARLNIIDLQDMVLAKCPMHVFSEIKSGARDAMHRLIALESKIDIEIEAKQ